MGSERQDNFVIKSTVFDLIQIFEQDKSKAYTADEIKTILTAYVNGMTQK